MRWSTCAAKASPTAAGRQSAGGGCWTAGSGPTERLVQALEACAVRPAVLVNASAVGFYGARDDRPVDEAAPAGQGFLPQVCSRWEAAAQAAAAHGVRVVTLRLGVVLARDRGRPAPDGLPGALLPGGEAGRRAAGAELDPRGRPGVPGPGGRREPRLPGPGQRHRARAGEQRSLHPRPVPKPAPPGAAGPRLGHPGRAAPAPGTDGQGDAAGGGLRPPGKAGRLGFAFRFPKVEDALADLA